MMVILPILSVQAELKMLLRVAVGSHRSSLCGGSGYICFCNKPFYVPLQSSGSLCPNLAVWWFGSMWRFLQHSDKGFQKERDRLRREHPQFLERHWPPFLNRWDLTNTFSKGCNAQDCVMTWENQPVYVAAFICTCIDFFETILLILQTAKWA